MTGTVPPVYTEAPASAPAEPPIQWKTGYLSSLEPEIAYYHEDGTPLGTLLRGTQVEYEITPDGQITILLGDTVASLQKGAAVVADIADVIPTHTLYVRTAMNLSDREGRLLTAFAAKGTAAEVIGYDYLQEDGQAHMYRVACNGQEGYIRPWYLAGTEEEAVANYDNGSYAIHADRADQYGGGGAADLDYYPRVKGTLEDNEMPDECRALYLASWSIEQVDAYLEIAAGSSINAFVVDIVDGGAVGYASDVMRTYCPSGAAAAHNTVEAYQEAIQKLKDAGYYVIGRIAAFNDSYFAKDHPEYAIVNLQGEPMKLSGEYWPSPFSRTVWQYKADLAVEAVEESFLQRNYGADYGDLYKPDSMNFGGGRGNGKNFNMEDFMADRETDGETGTASGSQENTSGTQRPGMQGGNMPAMPNGDMGNFDPSAITGGNMGNFDPSTMFGGDMGNFDPSAIMGGNMPTVPGGNTGSTGTTDGDKSQSSTGKFDFGGMMGGFGGMGGSDVKLQYAGDDADSYSNIFSSAKTPVTAADETRLIAALKALSEGDAENSVDIDAVLRYFVVHNFAVNGDSYTGSMIHNYYLYEEDGLLAMLPWDYNLAYGTFQGGNAESAVNDPIDTPLSVTGSGDRPMADWIFSNEAYTEQYHQYFAEFLQTVDITGIIDEAAALIAPYVEKDPTAFYTYEEFLTGTETLREFCVLRTESVQGQLDGTVPSTDEGQRANDAVLVDASGLNLSSMGSMGGGMGGGFGGDRGDRNESSSGKTEKPDASGSTGENNSSTGRPTTGTTVPEGITGMTPPDGTTVPEGITGMTPPNGTTGTMPTQPQTGNDGSGTAGGQQSGGNSGTTRPSSGNAMGGMPNFGGMGGDFTGGNWGGSTDSTRVPGQSGSTGSTRVPRQSGSTSAAAPGGDLILWIVTAAVLAGSLLFAKFYRRRTR